MSDGKFDLDGHCLSEEHPWSILDFSLPNAQLAGVFAGFMILAIATLLTMSVTSSTKEKTPTRVTETIVLLGLGIVVLAQNSYFFGSIAATKPPKPDHQAPIPVNAAGNSIIVLSPNNPQVAEQSQQIAQKVCERAWVQFMPAAGMLAVGAAALVAGIVWMIVWYRLETPANEKSDLIGHANYVTAFVLWSVMGAVLFDLWYFVEEMHNELQALVHDPAADFERWFPLTVGIALCLIATWILIQKRCSLSGDTEVDRDRILPEKPDPVYRVARGTAIYLLLAFGLLLLSTKECMRSHPLFELWAGISLAVFGPGILFVLLAFAMPGTNGPWPRRVLTLAGLALGIAFLVRSSIFIFQLGHRLGAEEGQCRLTE